MIDNLQNLETAKALKLIEVNEKFEARLNTLVSKYPSLEISTFSQQKEEAISYLKDKDSSKCPMLSMLAQHRGIELEDLCNRVMNKTNIFAAVSGTLMGQRQKMEDMIDASTSQEELNKIEINYILNE